MQNHFERLKHHLNVCVYTEFLLNGGWPKVQATIIIAKGVLCATPLLSHDGLSALPHTFRCNECVRLDQNLLLAIHLYPRISYRQNWHVSIGNSLHTKMLLTFPPRLPTLEILWKIFLFLASKLTLHQRRKHLCRLHQPKIITMLVQFEGNRGP